LRKYLRHPVDIPIEFDISESHEVKSVSTGDVSICGLSFISDECIEKNKILTIRIPLINSEFSLKGRVVRCVKKNGHVEIGIEFISQSDLYATRMIEQICYIKQYQKDVAKKFGRKLTDREAAREWIQKHASEFPK
jgi:hypothetical protein